MRLGRGWPRLLAARMPLRLPTCPAPTPAEQGLLVELTAEAMEYNLQFAQLSHKGGEAQVHLLTWREPPWEQADPAPGGAALRGGCGDLVGKEVAVKVYHHPDGKGGFIKLDTHTAIDKECAGLCRGARQCCAALPAGSG